MDISQEHPFLLLLEVHPTYLGPPSLYQSSETTFLNTSKYCLPFLDDLVGPQVSPDPDAETIQDPWWWVRETLGRVPEP